MSKLSEKTFIVVGATGGIGSVFAQCFLAAGANVVLVARTKDKLEALNAQLITNNAQASTLVCPADATSQEDMIRVFEEVRATFGSVDAVVIAAGTWERLAADASVERAITLASKHFGSIFMPAYVTGFVAQQFFAAQGWGTIFNISSHAAIRPELLGNLTYGPMKAASRHFMLSLAAELKHASVPVQVCDIQPAIVNTPDAAGLLKTPEQRDAAVQPEDMAKWIIENFQSPELPINKLFDSSVVI